MISIFLCQSSWQNKLWFSVRMGYEKCTVFDRMLYFRSCASLVYHIGLKQKINENDLNKNLLAQEQQCILTCSVMVVKAMLTLLQ